MHNTFKLSRRIRFIIHNVNLRNFNHIWLIIPNKLHNLGQNFPVRGLLSDEELKKLQQFKFQEDQVCYLVSHTMLRVLLGEYLHQPASEIRFRFGVQGKPFLNTQSNSIYFNLTHTKELIAIIVSSDECGVDAEKIDREFPAIELGKDFFSIEEYHKLLTLSGEEQLRYFFQLWTLKEAYLKGIGKGIVNGLSEPSFQIFTNGEIAMDGGNHSSNHVKWNFRSFFPSADEVVSIASKSTGGYVLNELVVVKNRVVNIL